jgi:hypothetical protein
LAPGPPLLFASATHPAVEALIESLIEVRPDSCGTLAR